MLPDFAALLDPANLLANIQASIQAFLQFIQQFLSAIFGTPQA